MPVPYNFSYPDRFSHIAGDQAEPQDTIDEDSRGVGSELRTVPSREEATPGLLV